MEKRDAGQRPRKGRRQPSPTRRWDIDVALLQLLGRRPRTASSLFRALNPGLRRRWVATEAGPRRRTLNIEVDGRTLQRHLRYLQRDGHVQAHPQRKILHRDIGAVTWRVTYYTLTEELLHPPPPHAPDAGLQPVAEIHNPFPGPEGAIRFIRWLRDPQ